MARCIFWIHKNNATQWFNGTLPTDDIARTQIQCQYGIWRRFLVNPSFIVYCAQVEHTNYAPLVWHIEVNRWHGWHWTAETKRDKTTFAYVNLTTDKVFHTCFYSNFVGFERKTCHIVWWCLFSMASHLIYHQFQKSIVCHKYERMRSKKKHTNINQIIEYCVCCQMPYYVGQIFIVSVQCVHWVKVKLWLMRKCWCEDIDGNCNPCN